MKKHNRSRSSRRGVVEKKLAHKTHKRWMLENFSLTSVNGRFSQYARRVINAYLVWIASRLRAGERVQLYGVGTFFATWRKGRTIHMRNRFGKPTVCTQPNQYVLKFRPSETMKKALRELAVLHPDPTKIFVKRAASGVAAKIKSGLQPSYWGNSGISRGTTSKTGCSPAKSTPDASTP